jgi:lipoprotein-anchoring transpeptidase ErfK/SrfK
MAKRIYVVLDRQVLQAFDGDEMVYEFDCCTGDSDHPTTTGAFRILHKHRFYHSRKYDAQMDYAMFFTRDGKAIHQGVAVGLTSLLRYLGADSVGSHGCVRLAEEDAATMFEWTPRGTPVIVTPA